MDINKNSKNTLKLTRHNINADAVYPNQISKPLEEGIIFYFPDGIPAFEDAKRFVIVLNPAIKPFLYLKSLDIETLSFICIDPFLVCPSYSINIPAKDLAILELKNPAYALTLSLVTVESDPTQTTTNLLAPIIINIENYVGRQVILNENYPVRYKIWEALENLHDELESK